MDLSLLQEDTGRPDVLPESLGLHLRLPGEAKEKRAATKKRKRTESERKQVSICPSFVNTRSFNVAGV